MPSGPLENWVGKLLRTDCKVMFRAEPTCFIEPDELVLVLEILQGEKMKVLVSNREQKVGIVWSTELLINSKQV